MSPLAEEPFVASNSCPCSNSGRNSRGSPKLEKQRAGGVRHHTQVSAGFAPSWTRRVFHRAHRARARRPDRAFRTNHFLTAAARYWRVAFRTAGREEISSEILAPVVSFGRAREPMSLAGTSAT